MKASEDEMHESKNDQAFDVEVLGRYTTRLAVEEAVSGNAAGSPLEDIDQWTGRRCQECGVPLVSYTKGTRGRPPKYCKEHRNTPSAKKTDDKDNESVPVHHSVSAHVQVPSVTSEAAPVAFRIRGMFTVDEIRLFDGRLFKPHTSPDNAEELVEPGGNWFPSQVTRTYDPRFAHADSEEAFEEIARSEYRKFVVIDGLVWRETLEPCYRVVRTSRRNSKNITISTGTLESEGQLFAADNFEGALEHAVEVAREIGLPARASELDETGVVLKTIEVVAPEAVALVAFPPAPEEVRKLREDYYKAVNRADDLRSRILALGYAPRVAPPYEARYAIKERP